MSPSSIDDLYWALRDALDKWLVDTHVPHAGQNREATMSDVGEVMLCLRSSLQELNIVDNPRPKRSV